MDKNNNYVKENFCGACIAVPLAMVGVGAAGVGSTGNKKGEHKRWKTILLWVGIILTVLSAIIGIYFLMSCKTCR